LEGGWNLWNTQGEFARGKAEKSLKSPLKKSSKKPRGNFSTRDDAGKNSSLTRGKKILGPTQKKKHPLEKLWGVQTILPGGRYNETGGTPPTISPRGEGGPHPQLLEAGGDKKTQPFWSKKKWTLPAEDY